MQPSPRVARGHTFGEMHRAGDRTNRHLIVLTEWLPLEGRHVLPLGGHVMHGEAHRELDAVGFTVVGIFQPISTVLSSE